MNPDCQVDWDDGWGHQHSCFLPTQHHGDHRCRCDQTISWWVVENSPETLAEAQEDERIRLREQLKAAQAS